MADVGIVVVTWNSGSVIGKCLDSAAGLPADLIVVDNHSQDDTCEEVRRRGARLLANAENRGFAAALNQGIEALGCRFVLVLNPDAILLTGVDALHACCEREGIAAAGGTLLNPDGTPQTGFMVRRLPTPAALMFEMLLINRLWPGNPVNRRYRCLNADYSKPFEAEQPAGAFLMIRRDCWEELGGFDEGFYPLWFEDADYCARARKAGFRILFTPEAVAKHTGGHTIAALTVENRQLYWYGSLLRYAARHFRGVEFRAICLGVIVGSFLRMVTGIMVEKSLAPLRVYARAAALAARSLAARRRG